MKAFYATMVICAPWILVCYLLWTGHDWAWGLAALITAVFNGLLLWAGDE